MIIITGASKGIGHYLMTEYINKGEEVIGFFNNTIVESEGKDGEFVRMDICDHVALAGWVKQNAERLSRITIVNCAAINYNSFAHKSDIEKWAEVINVNVIGTFKVILAFLPLMRDQSYGRIINFGSVVSELPSPGISAYAASKSALTGLVKSIAVENAGKGITINNINLGYSELGMISQVPQEYLNAILKKIPIGKLCAQEDIFNTVEYIRKSEYLTGTNINLNGGII
ncbi:acetoacetyl-CoA reductase [Cnuella takakiae]|uniref:Acetoacetyl-CoA reductase n=1 Tax=Cnuella takakiae TaxID=1302690 RepID=A0A1M5B996_9BACT|nr:SDR family oxidoreductase [Cnuella takakiae]SHF39069.1 acetoacetyl-CoA reductase [Cnuella takakiae]